MFEVVGFQDFRIPNAILESIAEIAPVRDLSQPEIVDNCLQGIL